MTRYSFLPALFLVAALLVLIDLPTSTAFVVGSRMQECSSSSSASSLVLKASTLFDRENAQQRSRQQQQQQARVAVGQQRKSTTTPTSPTEAARKVKTTAVISGAIVGWAMATMMAHVVTSISATM